MNHASFAPEFLGQLLPPVFDTAPSDVPRETEPWPEACNHPQIAACLERAHLNGGWHWPDRPVVFVSDTHADAEGFLRSLAAAGVIRRDSSGFHLTEFGSHAQIILGGDTFDKGPSNLGMLDALGDLRLAGANLKILAGNHDLRLRMALDALRGPRSVRREHLFVRMGRKILPALREVLDRYVTPSDLAALPDDTACAERLFPRKDWPVAFARAARVDLGENVIRKEVSKLQAKQEKFDQDMAQVGMTHREVLAAALKAHQVFFSSDGPYAWFFDELDVVARYGSLLFVHAGLCDRMCELLVDGGVEVVNERYREAADSATLEFYFGPLANLVRTKYRDTDGELTKRGVDLLHQAGMHMVVQGHVNNHSGQRLISKRGLLHLEGDVTLDRTSRRLEGLDGIGAGATLIFPSGDVIGLSRDYPRAKHFAPDRFI